MKGLLRRARSGPFRVPVLPGKPGFEAIKTGSDGTGENAEKVKSEGAKCVRLLPPRASRGRGRIKKYTKIICKFVKR